MAVAVRYTTKPERADENQAFVEKVFAELAATRPEGLRYLTLRLADGVSFLHVASVETEDKTNPLAGVAAFADFQADIADRLVEGPIASDATIIASYGFGMDEGDER